MGRQTETGYAGFSVRQGGLSGRTPGRKTRRRREGSSRTAIFVITAAVCILFLVLLSQGVKLKAEIDANEARKADLMTQIEAEESRTDQIEDLREYYESDDYIRQVAGDRLGLVDEGQIVFRSDEE